MDNYVFFWIIVLVVLVDVLDFLRSKNINFKVFEHSAVFTCEEADKQNAYKELRGVHSKNLFLKSADNEKFFLVIIPADERLDLKKIELLCKCKIKFANENDLMNVLGLTKGAVSPFGLINDAEHKTVLLVDKKVLDSEFVSFHPNRNTATLELLGKDFKKFVELIGNEFKVLE